jgi:hypothetical protein
VARLILTPLDMSKLEIRNQLVHILASAPGSPVEGQIYYDSTTKTLQVRTNAAWLAGGARLDQITAPTAAVALGSQRITGLADPGAAQDAATQNYVLTRTVNQLAAPTADFAMNSHKITGLLDGTNATDAVTKQQLDIAQAGLDVKSSVRAASTANLAGITYTATGGTSARGQITVAPNTLDGVTLAANNRILLKDQTTAAQNGIWVVTTVGTGANGVWDRATDADADVEVTAGMYTFVEEGTANDNTGWVLTTNNPITIGGASGTSLAFTKFTGAATGSAKFTALIGDGSTTAIAVTHSLGQQYVVAQVYDAASNLQVECDITLTSTTVTTFTFAVAPTTNQYRVVIVG